MFYGPQIFTAEWLPDGSGKPGEAMCLGLCRTCNEQPEPLLNYILLLTAPDFSLSIFIYQLNPYFCCLNKIE